MCGDIGTKYNITLAQNIVIGSCISARKYYIIVIMLYFIKVGNTYRLVQILFACLQYAILVWKPNWADNVNNWQRHSISKFPLGYGENNDQGRI
jgi:hypothetical protein